jgi:hypothetical protein
MQDSAPKILLIGLLALALLFIGGLLLGAGHGSNEPADLSPGWIEGIQQTFARPARLELTEISQALPAACLRPDGQALVIPVNKTCTYSIRKSATNVRRGVFNIASPGLADLFVDQQIQGKDSVRARQTLPISKGNSDNPAYLDIYQNGGLLTIFCRPTVGLSQCLLTPA